MFMALSLPLFVFSPSLFLSSLYHSPLSIYVYLSLSLSLSLCLSLLSSILPSIPLYLSHPLSISISPTLSPFPLSVIVPSLFMSLSIVLLLYHQTSVLKLVNIFILFLSSTNLLSLTGYSTDPVGKGKGYIEGCNGREKSQRREI